MKLFAVLILFAFVCAINVIRGNPGKPCYDYRDCNEPAVACCIPYWGGDHRCVIDPITDCDHNLPHTTTENVLETTKA